MLAVIIGIVIAVCCIRHFQYVLVNASKRAAVRPALTNVRPTQKTGLSKEY